MSKNSSTWRTVDELRQRRIQREKEQEKENIYTKYKDLKFDGSSGHYTIDELRQAAIKQGLRAPDPVQKPVQNIDVPRSAQNNGAALGSMVNAAVQNPLDMLIPGRKEQRERQSKAYGFIANELRGNTNPGLQDLALVQKSIDNAKPTANADDKKVYQEAEKLLMNWLNENSQSKKELVDNTPLEKLQKAVDGKNAVSNNPFGDDSWLHDDKLIAQYLDPAKGNNKYNAEGIDYGVAGMGEYEFFTKYRDGAIPASEENQKRYNELKDRLVGYINNRPDKNTDDVLYTDEYGDKVNMGDAMRIKANQNVHTDITSSPEQAGKALSELLTSTRKPNATPVSTAELKSAGWDATGDSIINYAKPYSSTTYNNAAVFSPVVMGEDGSVERILSPDELEKYADDVLSGKRGDNLGLQMTETYEGNYAASLADVNAQRIRRLSEKQYAGTEVNGVEYGNDNKSANDLGVDPKEYVHYLIGQQDKKTNDYITKQYSDMATGAIEGIDVPEWAKPAQKALSGIAATAANIATSPLQALEYIENIASNLSGSIQAGNNMLSAYRLPNVANDYVTNLSNASTSAITEEIRNGIRGDGDNDFLNGLADAAANTYGGISSGAQSVLIGLTCEALFPGVGSAVAAGTMSMQAAENTYNEQIRNGATVGRATMYSALSGLNEYIGEKVSLENLFSIVKAEGKQTAKQFLVQTLKQSGVEASEEVTTSLLNELADRIVNGDQATYFQNVQRYLEAGYSQEEAEKKASEDFYLGLVQDAYGGFVGGLIGGGVGSAANLVNRRAAANAAGQAVYNEGTMDELYKLAESMAENEAVKKQRETYDTVVEKYGRDSNKAIKQAGKLYAAIQDENLTSVDNALSDERQKALEKLYAEQINADVADATVAPVAKILNKHISGENLSAREQRILNNNSVQNTLRAYKAVSDEVYERAQLREEEGEANKKAARNLTRPKEATYEANIDDFNTHTDDNNVYTADGTEQVDIKNIAAVGRNDVQVELTNGKTESIKKLSLPEGKAAAYQAALDTQSAIGAEISPELFGDIVNEIESVNDGVEASDIQKAIQNGYVNNSVAYNADTNTLSESAYKAFYEQGRKLAATHTKAQRAAVQRKAASNQKRGAGSVTFTDGLIQDKRIGAVSYSENGKTYRGIGKAKQTGVDLVSRLAKALGFDVVFYRSTQSGEEAPYSSQYVSKNGFAPANQAAPNGFWRNGTMYLDINSGMNGEGLILYTASHELVHMIREGSPASFDALADFIVENYVKTGVNIDDLIQHEMDRNNLSYDEAYEEVIARACEDFLRDTHINDKAKALYKQDRTLWEKIRDALKQILDNFKELMEKGGLYEKGSSSAAARLTARMGYEIVEQAHDLWIEGILDSAENLRREYSDIDTKFSIREEAPPKKTVKGYKVFRIKDGKLYPPMVANPGGADTPVGVWLNADVGERAPDSKTGRAQVKGKGGMSLSFRPGWHLGDIPRASQFDRKNPETGVKDMFPSDFVWAECDCAADVDYQDEAMSYGYTDNGKFRHAYAGLPRIPENGYYKYRTNPRPDTVPWIITGAIKVNRILSDVEVAEILEKNGVTPPERQGGNKTLEELGLNNGHIKRQSRSDADYLSAVERGDMETAQRMVDEAAEKAGYNIKAYHGASSYFNIFDLDKTADINLYGKGFYFTSDETDATNNYVSVDGADTRQKIESRAFELFSENGYSEDDLYGNDEDVLDKYNELYEQAEKEWKDSARIVNAYLKIKHPMIVNKNSKLSFQPSIVEKSKNNGYDGIIDYSAPDKFSNLDKDTIHYVVFSSEQIKLADPVTYDDNGDVIPLSERFDESNPDIRYQSRFDDFDIDLFEDDSVENIFAREYATHHEDIGEVLKNISDIELSPAKVSSIVNRILRNNLGALDAETRRTLSTELQLALENVDRTDPEAVSNEMIAAVRKAIDNAEITDEHNAENYKELRDYFKGGKYYLTDEQIADLKEHDMTLNDFKKAMMGKITIVKRENANHTAVNPAHELSLEGMYDKLTYPDEYLPFSREQWDEYGYHAPIILMETFDKLKNRMTGPMSEMMSAEDIDYLAVNLTAKLTGAIVEEKYKEKYHGNNSAQIRKALKEQQKQTDDYIALLVENLAIQHETQLAEQNEANKKKLAELKQKERERAKKREQEIREKVREQRSKNANQRQRTQLRNSARKKMRKLDKLLNRSDKNKTVKQGLRPTVSKLLEVADLLFPATRTLEQMAREGVPDATPAEQKLLDRYVEYLDIREKTTTKQGREHASAMLSDIRKALTDEKGVAVEVEKDGKKVMQKMSLTARERMRYDNAMRAQSSARLKDALQEVADAYSMVKDSEIGYIRDSFDQTILDAIADLRKDVGDTLAKDMTFEQLETLNTILTRTIKSIQNANKSFMSNKSVSDRATATMREVTNIRKLKDDRNKIIEAVGKLTFWNNMKPVYAMRHIGSDTLTEAYWNVQNAENVWYQDIEAAREFKHELDKKYGVGKLNTKNKKDFNFNKKASFTALDGSTFTLSLNQMMDIYAASRRPQALQHLLRGGFTFAKDAKGDHWYTQKVGAKVYQLTAETIDSIVSQLTTNEKMYVEQMQEYLSTVMADKGNEVSMELHGVKLFNEEIYWSISSTDIYAPQSERDQENKVNLVKKIRNAGFTNATVKNASNPIVLQGFEENWSNHVNEMSLYHAMTLPLEDFTKIINYRERGNDDAATTGVRGVINQAYGNEASRYLSTLIDDINGGLMERTRTGGEKFISLAKKGAVLANLSVILQQPPAVFRAMAYVNARYFLLASGNKFYNFTDKKFSYQKHNEMYEELCKYAPVAGIKRMGSFDTGNGRGVMDYLASGGQKSLGQKAYEKIADDIPSKFPQLADEISWVKLWQAIQHETRAKYGYKLGSEENKIKSGERFNEVVHLTQVYDSVMSRSQAMRSKATHDKILTSFMAEPTTIMNMVIDAAVQSKRQGFIKGGGWKTASRTIVKGVALSIVANSLLHAIAIAMRDDDDDETFADKYSQAFWGDIRSGVNPMTYFPILRDISSILEGYKVDRLDMSLFSNLWKTVTATWKKFENGTVTASNVIDCITAVASLFGIPAKNLVRDIRSVINTANTFNYKQTSLVDDIGVNCPLEYQKEYDKAWSQGYDEEQCEKRGESKARDYISKKVKDIYLEALRNQDTGTVKEIRQIMVNSGYYHSTKKNGTDLSRVDEILDGWRKNQEEADKRAKTAAERQK